MYAKLSQSHLQIPKYVDFFFAFPDPLCVSVWYFGNVREQTEKKDKGYD